MHHTIGHALFMDIRTEIATIGASTCTYTVDVIGIILHVPDSLDKLNTPKTVQ